MSCLFSLAILDMPRLPAGRFLQTMISLLTPPFFASTYLPGNFTFPILSLGLS